MKTVRMGQILEERLIDFDTTPPDDWPFAMTIPEFAANIVKNIRDLLGCDLEQCLMGSCYTVMADQFVEFSFDSILIIS